MVRKHESIHKLALNMFEVLSNTIPTTIQEEVEIRVTLSLPCEVMVGIMSNFHSV